MLDVDNPVSHVSLIINNSMLKLIFDIDGGDFKNYVFHSNFMFADIEPYKSEKCVIQLQNISYQNIATLTPV